MTIEERLSIQKSLTIMNLKGMYKFPFDIDVIDKKYKEKARGVYLKKLSKLANKK